MINRIKEILIILLLSVFVMSCAQQADQSTAQDADDARETYEWSLVTTWPKNFPGLGTGAARFGELIEEMSGGRITVTTYGAGELVGAFEIFDAVSRGTAELGHGAAYYWLDRSAAAQFFAAVPFGLTAQEMNSWLHKGGGIELWTKIYDRYNLIPLAGGNTGVQMGGWFNREINSIDDFRGLRMRIPGLGGQMLQEAGGVPVSLPGGEIFSALQSGAIDATEWVGPYNDLAFGFYQVAQYYYYPGWHEPGTTLEVMVNKEAFEALPEDLQSIVQNAARVANEDMLSDFTANNNRALDTLINEHNVELRRFPQDVMNEMARLTTLTLEENAANDPEFREVYESFRTFREQAIRWHDISELPYLEVRREALR